MPNTQPGIQDNLKTPIYNTNIKFQSSTKELNTGINKVDPIKTNTNLQQENEDFLNKGVSDETKSRGKNQGLVDRINKQTNPAKKARMERRLDKRKDRQANRLSNQNRRAEKIYKKNPNIKQKKLDAIAKEAANADNVNSFDTDQIVSEALSDNLNKSNNNNSSNNDTWSPQGGFDMETGLDSSGKAMPEYRKDESTPLAYSVANPFSPNQQDLIGQVYNPNGNDINQFQDGQAFNKSASNPNTLNEPPIPTEADTTMNDLQMGNEPMGAVFGENLPGALNPRQQRKADRRSRRADRRANRQGGFQNFVRQSVGGALTGIMPR